MSTKKIVGVLGGMGPYASLAFCQKITNLMPAKKDWDHLHIVLDSNPQIPSRSRHILYGEESPVPKMTEGCKNLENYPVDLIAIPCNSAAAFIPSIQPAIKVPILNIIEITANLLVQRIPGAKKVGVFGGHVTYSTRGYQSFLSKMGVDVVDHGESYQREIEGEIESLKLGRFSAENVDRFILLAKKIEIEMGCDALILGCTEFGCLPLDACNLPIIDSSTALAMRVIEMASE